MEACPDITSQVVSGILLLMTAYYNSAKRSHSAYSGRVVAIVRIPGRPGLASQPHQFISGSSDSKFMADLDSSRNLEYTSSTVPSTRRVGYRHCPSGARNGSC